MPVLIVALLTLIHVLVFVYWLGGDLGAFYASRYLTAEGVGPDRRLFAAKIIGDVDMAPRTALILTLPSGLALAQLKGWVQIGWLSVLAITAVFVLWLIIVWKRHLDHGAPSPLLAWIDTALRWSLAASLVIVSLLVMTGIVPWPVFLAMKGLALAGCVLMGLLIRRTLTPLFPALGALAQGGTSLDAERTIQITLRKARPQVQMIWALLILAAFFGLWAPTTF
ncbi:MAG: hypothetical protein AAF788_06465 [Pseudomonadota bacterium]